MKIVKDFMPLWQNQVNALDLRQMIIWLDSECGVMRSDRQNDVMISGARKGLQVQILPAAPLLL